MSGIDEARTVPARDGYPLAVRLYHGGKRVVVVNSATAVPQQFYGAFARALASAGYTAVTYDYRGVGGSRPGSLRGFEASTADWGLLDMAAVVDVAADVAGGPVSLVSHSVGGQLAGLLDRPEAVRSMLCVSSQSGYWRLQGGRQKAAVALHVHLTLPVLARVFGYVPWSRLSAAEDLPRAAALQWARWCRHPRYLLGDASLPLERFAAFSAPVLAYSVEDDPWGTARSVDAMMSAYPHVERRHVVPARYGLQRVGHFGFFRPAAEPLWREALDWLEAH